LEFGEELAFGKRGFGIDVCVPEVYVFGVPAGE
jgi:hypothetical protein